MAFYGCYFASDKIGTESQGWGILGWVANGLMDHMLSASSCVSAHQCEQLLGDRYLRITGQLPRKLMQLDNTSSVRIADFQSHAYQWFQNFESEIHSFVERARQAREIHARSLLP